MHRNAFLPVLAASLLGAVSFSSAQRAVPVANGTVYTMTAGPLSVVAGPSKGARIRSLKFDGVEMLYQDSSGSPPMHGSTFWPGPQAHWTTTCRTNNNNGCWPPPANIDGANTTYPEAQVLPDTTVTYASALDNGTGVRLRKKLWANLRDSSFSARYFIINGSANKVAYSPWEITRFASGGLLFWTRSDTDTIRGNGAAGTAMINMVRDTLGTKWFKYDSATVPTSGTAKLWDGSTGGWFARVDKSRLLYIKKFTDTPSSKKPPVNENEIEIYTAGRSGTTGGMAFLEMELQGPFDSIAVGDSMTWDVKWYVRRLPDSISISANTALLAYVNSVVNPGPVSIAPAVRLTQSSFGVNDRRVSFELPAPGKVSLSLVAANGQIVQDIHSGSMRAGLHQFTLKPAPKGVYWLVLKGASPAPQVRRVAFF